MTHPGALVHLLVHVESLPLRPLRLDRRRSRRPHRRRRRIIDDTHIDAALRTASCRGSGHRSHVFREHETRGNRLFWLQSASRLAHRGAARRRQCSSHRRGHYMVLAQRSTTRSGGSADLSVPRGHFGPRGGGTTNAKSPEALRPEFTATWLNSTERHKVTLTVAAGALLGFGVTLTSVGAGALGVAVLVALYPLRLTSDRLVATDIAHALPITVIAAAGHAILGHVDLRALACLLVGSIPGVIFATRATIRLPPQLTRTLIAIMLAFVSERLFVA